MTTDARAAFRAVYTNFKPIPSRKVVQIVFEAPIEHGDDIINILGMPNPDTSKWFGVARLAPPGPSTGDDAPPEGNTSAPSAAPSKRWEDMSYAQRAGMLCADPAFRDWLNIKQMALYLRHCRGTETPVAAAAACVRELCGVESRKEINTDPDAQRAFEAIYASFDTWRKYGYR